MTQAEKKLLATQIVGDGQSPNRFFVTTSPYVIVVDEFGDYDSEMLKGFSEDDVWTEVFDTYEEANEHYNRIELDHYHGICQIMLEDRFSMTRRLADADRARNVGAIHLIREILGNLLDHLAG